VALRRRTRWILIGLATFVVVAGGAYLAFALLAGGSSPPPVSLGASTGESGSTTSTSAGTGAASASELPGTWTVTSNGSLVGYRVREQLGFLPSPTDAVGRTSAVTGTLVIDGTTITSVKVTADLTQLHSDRSMRDQRMHTIGLETDSFPTATFELTSPISFSSVPASGTVVTATAKGNLTLHGVTKAVTLQVQAKSDASGITVVGSLPIVMADYGITPPNIGGFVSVQDHGTMEFKLVFTKS